MKNQNFSVFFLACFTLFILSVFIVQTTTKKLNVNFSNKFELRKSKIIDGLGNFNKSVLIQKTFPFNVKKCEDMIEFEAEYIVDLNDYRVKNKAFFNLNIYRISMFESKNPTKLIHSVLLSSMTKVPQPLIGAKNCLSIDSGNYTAEMSVCLTSEERMKNIIEQIKKFDRCRAGDNLVEVPKEKIEELKNICNEQNGAKVSVVDPSKKKYNLPVRPNNKWDSQRDSFLYPKDYTVPGADTFELK